MADSAVDAKETTPVVEKDTVTSSVKESPVKETNGSSEDKSENGTVKNGTTPKENGSSEPVEKEEEEEEEDEEEEDVKENGDSDACAIKRKSCSGDAEAPDATTPEKKQKVADDGQEEPEVVEA